jgi:subtilisin-like proprotein convertase family protein
MKKTLQPLLLLCFILFGTSVVCQTNPWIQKNPLSVENKAGFENLNEELHKFYALNKSLLTESLSNVPQRGLNSNQSSTKIYFPNERGELELFSIFEAAVLEASLSQKYPSIKSYIGQSESGFVIRFSLDHRGLQAMIMRNDKTSTYIQFLDRSTDNHVVYRSDARSEEYNDFVCATPSIFEEEDDIIRNRDANDQILRTYRMAVSTTGEYAQFHGGTVADALAAINATITRVNMVFENDLAVTFEIQDFDQLIYTDEITDPYAEPSVGSNGNNFGTLNSWGVQLQNHLTEEIGNASYDIGHLFATNTAINGNAGCIGCVCNDDDQTSNIDNDKGAAYTSSENPIGEYFDLVTTHEIGHQMGANHTWSFNIESGTITNSEPGSGSTIMGYAGITGDNNVVLEPSPYFHYHSIRQISDRFISNNCWSNNNPVAITNNAPVVDAGNDYIIPKGTAYVLRGTATDADGLDDLYYCWEGIDNGQVTFSQFGPTRTVGGMVRSLPPTTNPDRYVPNLARVVAGELTETNPTLGSDWETVATVTRDINYALTVRDRQPIGVGLIGQSAYDTMNIKVAGDSGPFVVTSQATTETWYAGTNQNISWNVAGTDSGSVNTPTVNILLSIDGGQTFPLTLASDIPNSGSATISVPDLGDATINNARIIVEGNNNIFFAMNASDIEIQKIEFVIKAMSTEVSVCISDDPQFDFTYLTFLGFSGTTTFSSSNLPANTALTFNPSSATANGTVVTATLTGTENLSSGTYTFDLVATSGSATFIETVTLIAYDPNLLIPTLLSPADNADLQDSLVNFSWEASDNSQVYYLEVSENSDFSALVVSESLETNSYNIGLVNEKEYFWRVTPENLCEIGSSSNEFSFTTGSCVLPEATDLPITIPGSGVVNPYNSIITITEDLTIEDINVGITIDHTWNADLSIFLIAPNGTIIELSTDNGSSSDNYTNTIFDQEASVSITAGSGPFTGSFVPEGDLSLLYGLSSLGDWTLSISDVFSSADGGTIQNFELEICGSSTLSINTLDKNSSLSLYPNPNKGMFTLSGTTSLTQGASINVYDISGKIIYNKQLTNTGNILNERIDLGGISSGIYMVKLQNGNQTEIRKLVIK